MIAPLLPCPPMPFARIARNRESARAHKAKRIQEAKAKLQAAITPGNGTGTDEASDTAPRGGGKPKVNRRANEQGPTGFANSNCWFWPSDASLPLTDTSHRKAGLWAFDTVNPNAWPAGSEYMARSGADVILTQEVKVPDDLPTLAAEQAARSLKWKVAIEPCLITSAGGRSAGTAVATRAYIAMSTPKAATASQHLHPQGHFKLQRVAAAGKGGIHFGSLYCVSMQGQGGIQAKCNLDFLETMGFTLSSLVGPFCLGGDWNCTPAELRETGWLKKIGATIFAPSTPHLQREHLRLFCRLQQYRPPRGCYPRHRRRRPEPPLAHQANFPRPAQESDG